MVYVADDSSLTKWSQKTVQFSSGTGSLGAENTLIKITFGKDGEEDFLFASRDQVFLMPDRKLKRASRLVPGQDHLLRPDNTTVTVLDLTVGRFKKGVHHIATSQEPATSMDGHLIVAKGIVAGDFALQTINLTAAHPEYMVDNHDDLPEFGTKEYIQTYKNLVTDTFKAHLPKKKITKQPGQDVFEPLGVKGPVPIPEDAEYFFTRPQAKDIQENAPRSTPASGAGRDITIYLFKLFKGFYPDVHFFLDEENELPNAYSFIQYGIPFVVVTGALIRTQAVMFESLAVIIAHELGHLYGGNPKNPKGYTCTGMADFAAISAILPNVWFGLYSAPIVSSGIEQIEKIFNFISPKHRKGVPGNRCMYISIDCRIASMKAAANTRMLPECAGGPKDPFLQVTGAKASKDYTGKYVTVEFNTAVDIDTAQSLGNYSFRPPAPAYSAVVEPQEPTAVKIQIDIEEDKDYEVFVFNVLSADDQPLVAGKNHAEFKLDK
jgi:hypothetical protein